MLAQIVDVNTRTDQGVPMSKLTEAEILERLPRAKNWDRHGDMLVRTWQFPSFRRALEFINNVAVILEKADHYPDLVLNYRTVRIEMSTHDVGGLTDQDFALIAEINDVPTDR
jgi:4a-hydroxytetrahydrobiopterin dehydratase